MHKTIPIAPLRLRDIARSVYVYALLVIVGAGALVRFYAIRDHGIFIHDEGHFLNVVRTYGDAVRWLWKNRGEQRSPGEARDYLLRRGGSLFGTAKEGHIAAMALFSLVYGVRPTTGVALSAIFGTATLLLVFLLGARLYDVPAGVLAAAALASSALFLKYSRSGLAQADSIFFAYLGVFLYLLSRERTQHRALLLALAGASLGVAFTCHYNIAYVLIVLVCAEVLFPLGGALAGMQPRAPARWQAALILGAVFALYLVLFDIPFELAKIAIGGAYPGFFSYFGDLHYHVLRYHAGSHALGAAPARIVFDDPLYFIRILVVQEGAVASLLLLCGFVFFLARFFHERRCGDFVLIVLFAMPLAVWSFYSFRVERSFIVILPAAALIFGRSLSLLIERLRLSDGMRHFALLGAVLIILLSGWLKAQDSVLLEKTNFPQGARAALDYALRSRGLITERSFSWHTAPVWKFYLTYEADRRPEAAAVWRVLNLGSKEAPDILLLDDLGRSDADFMRELSHGRVVASVPATANLGTIFVCDVRQEAAEAGSQHKNDRGM
jgi:hypothetical protein